MRALLVSLLLLAGPLEAQALTRSTTDEAVVRAKLSDWVLAATEFNREADVLVVLSEQADLSRAVALPTRTEKVRFVFDTLVGLASRTQAPLIERLRELGVPHQPFFIVNAIAARGGREVLLEIARRTDVAKVEGNAPVSQTLPRPERTALLPVGVAAAEPGIVQSRAPDVWALGVRGRGIVVGGQDTGYGWDHPALKSAYRGWNGATASHDYNWHDAIHVSSGPCGEDAAAPCDDHSHGTHTMGTAVGLDGTNQIGMAPDARWIGCRNMDAGAGSPSTYLECFQFFLAPYPVGGSPLQGDPARAPHVTNNSWGCPPSEGCAVDALLLAVAAQRAAGIFTVVSAGNGGPSCSTVADPPAIYKEAFSVGALQTGTDSIASFSSRGPVTVDGSGRAKPDVAAPGTSIRSCIPLGGYTTMSGTSMAGPHVAGAVALLWSAQPALVGQIGQTERILADAAAPITSTDCGATSRPNFVFGWGRLDAKGAVDLALVRPVLSGLVPAAGSIQGGTNVTISGANFVSGATVTFGGTAATSVVVGSSRITAVAPSHAAGRVDVTVTNPDAKTGTLPASFDFLPPTLFYTVPPCRLLDTRDANGPQGGPALAPSSVRLLTITGSCSIPASAKAVSVNLAVVAGGSGHFRLYPGNGTDPGTATINFATGQIRSNNAVFLLATDGSGTLKVSNVSGGQNHLILDLNGYFQ